MKTITQRNKESKSNKSNEVKKEIENMEKINYEQISKKFEEYIRSEAKKYNTKYAYPGFETVDGFSSITIDELVSTVCDVEYIKQFFEDKEEECYTEQEVLDILIDEIFDYTFEDYSDFEEEEKEYEFCTIQEIEKNYGGKVTSVDSSYITVSNENWDNDLILYIEAIDASHAEYNRYQVVEAN